MQLPLIMLGHSYRAFTKLLALGTQKEEDEQYRRSTGATGLQRARSRGKDMGRPITAQVVKKRRFWVNIYLMLRVHNKQSDSLCVRLYIIYNIYLYMYIIIIIYVLFSDKRFLMPCHTLSIQVCRSTCFSEV